MSILLPQSFESFLKFQRNFLNTMHGEFHPVRETKKTRFVFNLFTKNLFELTPLF